jgi:DNA sulfur modification protein DndD
MIIKELIISNYQCYYNDNNKFEFTRGSNIILGKNGGGKTKFYEAIEWLFSNSSRDLDELVSKKMLSETAPNDTFRVGVEITFEQGNILNTVKKYFSVLKKEDRNFSTTSVVYEGIKEYENGERDTIDGQSLLNSIFPPTNRKYCLFKGETELNILNNNDALVQLINLYSRVKHYGPFAEKGKQFREYADKAIEEAAKKDKKIEKRYKELDFAINDLQHQINEKLIFLQTKNKEKRTLEENIQGVEKHLDNAEAVETIRNRIREILEKKKKLEDKIDENYTTALFDKNWFLIHFESIQKEFSEKIKKLSSERRKQQREFDKDLGIKEGQKRAKIELFRNVVPLPDDIPSRAIMEEMLKDEICKVCNRDAKIGSEPYEFMLKRLNEYILTQKPEQKDEEEKPELFKNNYTSRLVNLEASIDNNLVNVRSIFQTIKDHLEFNQDRKNDIEELNKKREKEEQDLENIIGSSEIGQDSLAHAFKNSKGWQRDLTAVNIKLVEYENKVKDLKKALAINKDEKETLDSKSVSTYLTQTRRILRDIETIFEETKEKKYTEFIKQLEQKANDYLKKINAGSFTGYIEIKRRIYNGAQSVEVNLMQDGEIFYHPNTSLQTSMHLAILFAISEMTKIDREECYPMIFDAPTSSFDPIKRKNFFDVLGECNEQTILLTKDFTDKSGHGLLFSEDFTSIKRDKAFLIQLEEPFDEELLSTINTQVINL